MSHNQTEIEVKLHTPDHTAIIARLNALNADLVQARIHEYNVRYDTDGALLERGEALRLRRDGRIRLTYKGMKTFDQGLSHRQELEVDVSDFETMSLMLERFGYQPYMVYEKYRTTYQLHGAEIMLDELPYGNFTEIEGETRAIHKVLQALSLEEVERRSESYTRIFEFVKHHLELNFRDLTFDNFKDVEVPESAFIPPGSIVIE